MDMCVCSSIHLASIVTDYFCTTPCTCSSYHRRTSTIKVATIALAIVATLSAILYQYVTTPAAGNCNNGPVALIAHQSIPAPATAAEPYEQVAAYPTAIPTATPAGTAAYSPSVVLPFGNLAAES